MGEFIENMRNRTKPSNETQFKMYMYSGVSSVVRLWDFHNRSSKIIGQVISSNHRL